jgi:hypothetical protein
MALSAFVIWEVETGGSDGTGTTPVNSGGFDPSQNAGMLSNLMTTSGLSSSPTVTSSYSFAQTDLGAFVFIYGGGNTVKWTPGWYKITGVSGGAATLSAAVGTVVLFTPGVGPRRVEYGRRLRGRVHARRRRHLEHRLLSAGQEPARVAWGHGQPV